MKIQEIGLTAIVDDKGYPIAALWKNSHVLCFELKEMNLDKYTRLLESLTQPTKEQ